MTQQNKIKKNPTLQVAQREQVKEKKKTVRTKAATLNNVRLYFFYEEQHGGGGRGRKRERAK